MFLVIALAAGAPAIGGDGMRGDPNEGCMVGPGVFAPVDCATLSDQLAAQHEDARQEPQAQPSYWNHNGSMMVLRADGPLRKFYYQAPRRGMVAAGARPGTLLFSGRARGRRYDGVAYIFNRNCGPLGYRVSGPILADDRVLLRSMAPRVNGACAIIGYRPDLLEFEFITR